MNKENKKTMQEQGYEGHIQQQSSSSSSSLLLFPSQPLLTLDYNDPELYNYGVPYVCLLPTQAYFTVQSPILQQQQQQQHSCVPVTTTTTNIPLGNTVSQQEQQQESEAAATPTPAWVGVKKRGVKHGGQLMEAKNAKNKYEGLQITFTLV